MYSFGCILQHFLEEQQHLTSRLPPRKEPTKPQPLPSTGNIPPSTRLSQLLIGSFHMHYSIAKCIAHHSDTPTALHTLVSHSKRDTEKQREFERS
ncbi:hypothetical protein QQG55_33435 [Brugia pahangi]